MAAKLEVKKTDDGAFELSVAPNSMKVGETREFDFPHHHLSVTKVKVCVEEVVVDDLFGVSDDDLPDRIEEILDELQVDADVCCVYTIKISCKASTVEHTEECSVTAYTSLKIIVYPNAQAWADADEFGFDATQPYLAVDGMELPLAVQYNNSEWRTFTEE